MKAQHKVVICEVESKLFIIKTFFTNKKQKSVSEVCSFALTKLSIKLNMQISKNVKNCLIKTEDKI